jgi:hypothetical protein
LALRDLVRFRKDNEFLLKGRTEREKTPGRDHTWGCQEEKLRTQGLQNYVPLPG